MYIKGIVIDGFKSYGKRTEIHGFDSQFNAITGLNGTGKSNILDSICFVLGISNLVHVRATSLQDLVFKSGQAGITKATVTLVFDNTDKDQCPIGFEKCDEISVTRQIVVNGKNKYLINGKNVQNKRVQDLFCSVQLNVNNPNFLIMQGRITKVLNMKPQEILSMIEEAAGTSMYETKRDLALKNIEKKEAKLGELNNLLKDVIEPKLEKLRKERAHYLEYQKVCRDIEYFTRLYISHLYLRFQKAVKKSTDQINALNEGISAHKETTAANELLSTELDAQIQEMQGRVDEESGGALTKLEEELAAKTKEETAASASRNSTNQSIAAEERKLKAQEKSIRDDEAVLQKKSADMAKAEAMFQGLKDADATDSKAFADAQKKFEAVTAGLSTNEDGEASTLQDQLITAKQQVTEASTTIKQSEMELKHATASVREKQTDAQQNDTAYTKDKQLFDRTEAVVKQLTTDLSKIQYEDGSLETLQQRSMQLTHELRKLNGELDKRNAHTWDLQYRDPAPNFNRNSVKGRVGVLFDVPDKKNCLALGICAGGSLYSVVTDTEVTSKAILKNGDLQTRTNFIPLNKISGRSINPQVVKYAQDLVGKENVAPALSLIKYDPELEPAMQYIFGTTFICKDMNVARKVTFDPRIRCRSVTLEGDVMDPDGSLSGGAAPKGGAVLLEVAVIRTMRQQMHEREQQRHQIDQEMSALQKVAQRFGQLKEQLELRKHEMESVSKRLATTSFQQNQSEIEELKARIEELRAQIAQAKETQQKASQKVKDIESRIKDSKGHRERELKSAEDEMKRAKKKSEESRKNWKKHEQEFETLRLEIKEIEKGIVDGQAEMVKLQETIVKLKEKLETCMGSASEISAYVSELKANIKRQKDAISAQHKEIKQKMQQKDKMTKQNQDIVIDIKKKENEISKVQTDNKDGYGKITRLEEQYPWIPEEKEYFGGKNTRYDYSKEDPEEAGKKLKKLQESKDVMGLNINQKAMMLLEREEEQFKEVSRRRSVVELDKKKIFKFITELDEEKKKKLQIAWNDVNINFGSIFSTLLPGAEAKLVPPDGMNFLKGLEVKVGFNGLWKEALTELSGGQRSLVALSLILAMLKYKPAPLYILDEVDAALDLSHTQNIGNMLKQHFTNSQFIIVSLKDGMFNNANVLFRTRFVDGMSAVQRTVNTRR